ncbi:calcitonin gene-related peptide type 1 receptor-like [Mytilus edulis]|uniref:calcitonin gene-related peptide type 1 receptor-like n=1 Tax=Mytilus edulis TaxID=6550 RepID=UPI0039F017A8
MIVVVTLIIILEYIVIVSPLQEKRRKPGNCRDRDGIILPISEFEISTCAMCYFYLIKENPKLFPVKQCSASNSKTVCLMEKNKNNNMNYCHCPSINNASSLIYIDNSIGKEKLSKQWHQCCEDAANCCNAQTYSDDIDEMPEDRDDACPHTWDGWMCWNKTLRKTSVHNQCPRFLSLSDYRENATKICTGNGTWWVDPETLQERTDYSKCLSKDALQRLKFHKISTIVSLSINAFGISLLIPAIIVFVLYRNLRRQNRIKLHINLFLSLLLCGITVMCWDVMIKYNKIVNQQDDIVQYNQHGCILLNMTEHYFRSTTYYWMLCEGFYLHRLLLNAFVPPKRLIGYYITGWGMPLITALIYTVLRISLFDNSDCWIDPVTGKYHGLEWILFAPTILCIIINVFFLLNILRVLVRQLSHPNEPKTYRKAVKATLILIPLLGVHQFFTIYRPRPGDDGYYEMTMTAAVIYNSQAILISFIFFYFNSEVLSNLRTSLYRRRQSAILERKSLTSTLNSRRSSAVSSGPNTIQIYEGIPSDLLCSANNNVNNHFLSTRVSNGVFNHGFVDIETTHL